MEDYPFKTVGQALCFYKYKSPARQKFKNILEVDYRASRTSVDFTGDSSRDIYASVVWAIENTLRNCNEKKRQCFILRELNDADMWGVSDIADFMGIAPRTVYKWLREIKEDLETELVKRRLMEPDEYESNDK